MLWFAVNRSIDASAAPPPSPEPVTEVLQGLRRLASAFDDTAPGDLTATLATMRGLVDRLGELATTLQRVAALKVWLDGTS